jgi:DNA-binding NtrC family response regulator
VVMMAENAQQARQIRSTTTPDLVLLDIWMPDTDGVTLLKEWQRDRLLTMPVIMMSGHATIDTAVEATRIGALNFLEKPISLQKLLKAVQQGLSRSQEITRNGVLAAARPVVAVPAVEAPAKPVAPGPVIDNIAPPEVAKPAEPGFTVSFELPLREARDAFERAYFEHHLQREGGSMTRVAERTGLERTHLYRKLKQLGVEPGKLGRRNHG